MFFLSIHFNGFEDSNTQGTETWTHRDAADNSKLLAQVVQQRVVSATGYRDRGIRNKDLGVLRPRYHAVLTTAACLVEISFLTNPSEEERLRSTSYKDRLAEAIVNGILDYLSNQSRKSLKKLLLEPFVSKSKYVEFYLTRSEVGFINGLTEADEKLIETIDKEPVDSKSDTDTLKVNLERGEWNEFIDRLIGALERMDGGGGGRGRGRGDSAGGGEGEGEGEGDFGEDG